VSSPDQFLGNEERGLISPAIPGEDTKEIKHNNKRTIVIRLLPWVSRKKTEEASQRLG